MFALRLAMTAHNSLVQYLGDGEFYKVTTTVVRRAE